jgi:myo-inositol-1(or 4)-monophosphatase
MLRSALLNVMIDAVRRAGRALARDFGEVENLQVSVKGPGDFVSAADLKAEKTIRELLEKARPGYGFLLEEGGSVEGADRTHRWILDPLDGTTNFLHGIPHFAISLALERDGVIVAGVIHNPVTNELYWAERGKGAFLDDRRLRVSARREPIQAIFGTGIPFAGRGDHGRFLKEMAAVMPRVAGVRRMGAAALDLAYVAAGRFDVFWERGLSPWDMAAGIVLIREAGGFVTDLNGRDAMMSTGDCVAGNEVLHRFALETISKAA